MIRLGGLFTGQTQNQRKAIRNPPVTILPQPHDPATNPPTTPPTRRSPGAINFDSWRFMPPTPLEDPSLPQAKLGFPSLLYRNDPRSHKTCS